MQGYCDRAKRLLYSAKTINEPLPLPTLMLMSKDKSMKYYEAKGFRKMKRPSLISDFAQVATGAASAFGGVKGEMDVMIQSQIEKILAKRGLVSREDFEAAQLRITAQGERIAALESQLEALSAKKAPKTATKSAKKA